MYHARPKWRTEFRHEVIRSVQGMALMLMVVVFVIVVVVSLLSVVGCSMLPADFDQGLALIDQGAMIAEKQGVAFTAEMEWTGDVGLSWKQKAAIESGVIVKLRFHGNAASQRSAVQVVEPDG